MKQLALLIILLITFSHHTLAQDRVQEKIDSLTNVLQSAEKDSLKVKTLFYLSREYYKKGKKDKSISYIRDAIKLAKELGNKKMTASGLSYIGNAYMRMYDYANALDYYKKALSLDQEIGDKTRIARDYANIARLHSSIDDFSKALKYYQKSIELLKQTGDKNHLAVVLNNLGTIYRDQSNYVKALEYFKKSYKTAKETGNQIFEVTVLLNIGIANTNLSNYTRGLKDYQKALKMIKPTGDQLRLAWSYRFLGEWYLKAPDSILKQMGVRPSKKYLIAQEYLEDALEINKNLKNLGGQEGNWKILSSIYARQKHYEKALSSYKKYITLQDSIEGEEVKEKIAQVEARTKYEKKSTLAAAEREKENIRKRNIRNSLIGGLGVLLLFSIVVFRQRTKVRKEKRRSDELLLNILPEEISKELKDHGTTTAKEFSQVSVLFTDFVNFTQTSEKLGVKRLLQELNIYFSAFDEIMERHQIEKIKTIGDAYLAVCGLPAPNENHALHTVEAAIEIIDFIEKRKKESAYALDIRIGINSGPIIAGIIGVKKFAYDIWGDAVNIAARMEQNSEPGKINISESTYQLVKNEYHCMERGKIEAKGKGEINMYFIDPIKTEQNETNKENMNYQALEKLMLDKLEKELPKHLTYHCVEHILDVRDSAAVIARQENISQEDIVLLKTAALFHDSGFIFGGEEHEEKSCEIAKQYLPEYGYSLEQIDQICGMIMATQLPQTPKNNLEEILADADLDYLGRDDFFTIGEGLYQEFLKSGVVNNEDEWNRLQVEFLEDHHYFTQTSIAKRKPKKMEHLQMLKSKLNQE